MNTNNKKVILIMTDTQRKDMIGAYNKSAKLNTPSLDSLANNGIKYENAYTCQPVCGPARSAIFTGKFPHSNGSIANSMPLDALTKTVGQRLNENSIASAYIGKWHLDGGDYFGNGICPQGWDQAYWYDMKNYLDELSDDDKFKSRQFDTVFNDPIEEDFTFAHRCSNKAIDYIKKHSDDDYFLVVSYDEPHHPFLAPQKYFDDFKGKLHSNYGNVNDTLENKPEHIKVWAESTTNQFASPYGLLGCNAFVDYEIGRVLESIGEYADDALIIYTSDHGDALGAHQISNKGPAMYEEITNIPFIVSWNQLDKKNNTLNTPVSHIDIVPTILDAFDIDTPRTLEGKSLLSSFKDTSIETNEEVFIEFSRYEIDHDGFGGYQPIRCVVDSHYKLVINLLTSDELYDLQQDPGEMNNLIDSPDTITIRNALHDNLLNWMNETRDPYRGYYWENRPWRKDATKPSWDYTLMTRQRYPEKGDVHQSDYSTGRLITEYVRKK